MSPTKMNYPNDLNTNINCEELVIPAVGTIASVLYHRMRYWCRTNQSSGNSKYKDDDRWWTWDSYAGIQNCYPYYSIMQIRTAMKKLVDSGLALVKESKNFKRSNKYSAIELEDWFLTKNFNKLTTKKRDQIAEIIEKRTLSLDYVKNNKGYVKNNIWGVKNNTPIYIIDTIIRNIEEGAPQNSDDISNEEALRLEYDQLVIPESRLTIMLDAFADHVKHLSTVHKDRDKLINKLYRSERSGKTYPFWIRLLYGEINGLTDLDIRDAIAPRVLAEIKLNPYIMVILHNKFPAFNWAEMGIDAIQHLATWGKTENKVKFVFKNAKS